MLVSNLLSIYYEFFLKFIASVVIDNKGIGSLIVQVVDTVSNNDSIYLVMDVCYAINDTVLFNEKVNTKPIRVKEVVSNCKADNKNDKLLMILVVIAIVLLLCVIGYLVALSIKGKNKVKKENKEEAKTDYDKKIDDAKLNCKNRPINDKTVAKSEHDELIKKYNKLVEEKNDADNEIERLKKNRPQVSNNLDNSEIINLQEKYDKLQNDKKSADKEIAELKENQKKEIDDAVKNAEKKAQEKYDELDKKKESLEKEIAELKENHKKEIADAVKKAEEKAQRKYDDLNKQKESLDNDISELKKNQKKEIENAINKVEEKAQRKYDELNKKKESLDNEISELKKKQKKEIEDAVHETVEKAQRRYDNLESEKNIEIKKLQDEQKMFTTQLTSIPFAQEYAKGISKLNDVVDEVLSNAAKITELKLDDYYYINKPISKYAIKVSKIDMKQFATDVNMAAKSHFVFNDCTLSTFNQKDSENILKISTKQYFFEKYLKVYIDAIMILNESLSGVYHFMDDLPKERCMIFDTLRKKIIDACYAIDIDVFSVKLFDMIGEKIDLKVEKVDAPFGKTGQIIEVCNCQVKLKGGSMPDDKIVVKVRS